MAHLFEKNPSRIKKCFISGIIIGILTHIYMLTNKLPNWDDINCYWSYGAGETIGRWLLPWLKNWLGWMSVPALNGMVLIVCISGAACMIAIALDFKDDLSCILLAGILITFPSVISTMTFMFTSSCYGIAIVLTTLGVLIVTKGRKWAWLGILPLFLCMGIYQAYICLAAGLLVMHLILELLKGENFLDIFKRGLSYLGILLVSMGGYLIYTKYLSSAQLDTYKGAASMGQIPVTELPRLIARAYKRFVEYFIINPYSYTSSLAHVINVVICICIVVMVIALIVIKKIYKKRSLLCLLVILGILFPLAIASLYVIVPEVTKETSIAIYSYVLLYVMAIGIGDFLVEEMRTVSSRRIVKVLLPCLMVIIVICNYSLANNAYYRMSLANQRVSNYYNRIISDVESSTNYKYGQPILILGDFDGTDTPLSSMNLDDARYKDLEGVAMESGLMTSGVRRNYLRVFLGINTPEVTSEQEEKINLSEEYGQMRCYPSDEGIKNIEGIWVVKVAP